MQSIEQLVLFLRQAAGVSPGNYPRWEGVLALADWMRDWVTVEIVPGLRATYCNRLPGGQADVFTPPRHTWGLAHDLAHVWGDCGVSPYHWQQGSPCARIHCMSEEFHADKMARAYTMPVENVLSAPVWEVAHEAEVPVAQAALRFKEVARYQNACRECACDPCEVEVGFLTEEEEAVRRSLLNVK